MKIQYEIDPEELKRKTLERLLLEEYFGVNMRTGQEEPFIWNIPKKE